MKFLFEHPKKTKWRVYTILQSPTINHPHLRRCKRFAGCGYFDEWWGDSFGGSTVNFVFCASIIVWSISSSRNSAHVKMADTELDEDRNVYYVFSGNGFQQLMNIIFEGKNKNFRISPQGVITGVFTFEKKGTQLFTIAYEGDEM